MHEFADGKVIALVFKGISDDVGAQRYQFDSFELMPDLPADVVDSEPEIGRTVEEKKHAQGMEELVCCGCFWLL